MSGYLAVWRDGRAGPEAIDPGLLVGTGVFETLMMISGKTFALARHQRRLAAGAQRLGLPAPPPERIEEAVSAMERAGAGHDHARIRLTWTPGPGGQGSLLATAAPYEPLTSVAVHLSEFRRNEHSAITGVKCTSYAENLLALARAREHGADEALLANTNGDLCEGATSNVFIETGGELLTPPLSAGCLPGITRELCLEWGRAHGLPIRETPLPFSVMNTTEHAALTSALKGVVPVRAIGARPMETGPLTRRLADIYLRRRHLESENREA